MCTLGRQQYEDLFFNHTSPLQGGFSLEDLLVNAASLMSLLDADSLGEIAKNFMPPKQDVEKKDNLNFQVKVDVKNFSPEDIDVKTMDNFIVVTGKHEEKKDEEGYISRQFVRKFPVPEDVNVETITCSMDKKGILVISAPRILKANPQGDRMIPISINGQNTQPSTEDKPVGKTPVAGPSSATIWN